MPKSKRAGVSKPKQTKSRNGCITCKDKRLKCDETKPGCRRCQGRNVTCGGYNKNFTWKQFDESNFAKQSKRKDDLHPTTARSDLLPLSSGESPSSQSYPPTFLRQRPTNLSSAPVNVDESSFASESERKDSPHSTIARSDPPSLSSVESPSSRSYPPVFPRQPSTNLPSALANLKLQAQPESPEMLVRLWHEHTCDILPLGDGRTENPWKTLVWPLAENSPVLYNAICALTAFCIPSLTFSGACYVSKSLQILRREFGSIRTDVALATVLVLGFAEMRDQRPRCGIDHLKGAKSLINKAISLQQRGYNMKGDDPARLHFLYNVFSYMDTISRLTLPEEHGPSLQFHTQHRSVSEGSLLDCVTTLFPLINNVASLIQKIRRTEANLAAISQALEYKTAIEQWEPSRDPISPLKDGHQTAQAYRWATLLYLHQAVPDITSESALQLAKRVLNLLATVPPDSPTIITHIYPLLVAGCEVKDEEDRKWVRERWQKMCSKPGIGINARYQDLVFEVWKRRGNTKLELKDINSEKTVGGSLHWLGVMRDWKLELFIG